MRALLLAAMGGVPGARWQDDDQLHLTLRFIGEVDRHRAEDVAAALGAVHAPRFLLALDGIGQFDRRNRPDSLWVGVKPHAPLKALHNKIDQALIRIGRPPEGRAYLPHITLARFSRGATPVICPPDLTEAFTCAPEEIREFCLFESELGAHGASYTIAARYPLT